jgi:hypothetical protein
MKHILRYAHTAEGKRPRQKKASEMVQTPPDKLLNGRENPAERPVYVPLRAASMFL